jgi:hypothetical protein
MVIAKAVESGSHIDQRDIGYITPYVVGTPFGGVGLNQQPN